ncbi:MAG TPA: zinc-finger domain-containing protein [Rhodospirillales bacterium]|jgi:uncharacterized Zn-finger protein|nr:zinc-finger domain-containing protein [Rhodospirillales bacterium]HIM77606.1 zinc-finger domain-containing protein [Rhodospirillales bacterium]
MTTDEIIEVTTTTIGCDGGGVLGHPTVYLKIGDAGEVICPYCSRQFVLSKDASAETGH